MFEVRTACILRYHNRSKPDGRLRCGEDQELSRRILLCSVDGMRPDAIEAAGAPLFSRLIQEGSATLEAQTVMPSCTLPCHTSMLRGVDTARHGITSNQFQPLVRPVPSLLDLARGAGLRTGAFYNWEPLRDLADPGSVSVSYCWGDCHSHDADQHVADAAIDSFRRQDLQATFLYFGWVDEAGHKYGWMSEPYLEAVRGADACLTRVLEELEALGRLDELTLLLLSDHGGHARTHGTDSPEDITIPWILWGDGIRPGVRITESVRIYDTCVTLSHLLGLAARPEWDGQVIESGLIA